MRPSAPSTSPRSRAGLRCARSSSSRRSSTCSRPRAGGDPRAARDQRQYATDAWCACGAARAAPEAVPGEPGASPSVHTQPRARQAQARRARGQTTRAAAAAADRHPPGAAAAAAATGRQGAPRHPQPSAAARPPCAPALSVGNLIRTLMPEVFGESPSSNCLRSLKPSGCAQQDARRGRGLGGLEVDGPPRHR